MTKSRNLTGEIFGKWQVIKEVFDTGKSGRHWLCQCECGTEKVIKTSQLTPKSGTRQCASCKSVKDLSGKQFGHWQVLNRDFSRQANSGSVYWWCRCSCGKTVSVLAPTLVDGRSTQCGSCAQKENLIGQIFSRLTVIRDSGKRADNGSVLWECDCSCGVRGKLIRGSDLLNGQTKSCGCYSTDLLKKVSTTHGLSQVNGKRTKLFMAWSAMKQRCYNRNSKSYDDYGGRGITVCDEWQTDFKAFHDWSMANGFADSLSIDRIDNDKGYSPDNCRWTDAKTQIRNRRNTVRYTWEGKQYTIGELSELTGIKIATIKSRLNRGLALEDALEPVEEANK